MPTRMSITKKISVDKDVKKWGWKTLKDCWRKCKMMHLEKVWQFLKRLNTEFPYWPAIPFHSREFKAHVHRTTYAQMFPAALFIKSKSRNPNVHQLING